MGNLCEHICKVINICRKKGTTKPSISSLQYQQALTDLLRCPPHDSLIRDHAVSFAMSVQKQLNALISMGSNNQESRSPFQEHKTDTEVYLRDIVLRNKSKSNQNKSDRASVQEAASNYITDNASSLLIDSTVSVKHVNGETSREDCPCTEMDVDTTSISISPRRLNSVEEVVDGCVLSRTNIGPKFFGAPFLPRLTIKQLTIYSASHLRGHGSHRETKGDDMTSSLGEIWHS
ncbi:hypothetical protein SDJN03_27293, partial [Cucurbita argyrosperma subsp. sororia]